MVAIENVYLTFETPGADEPVEAFALSDPEQKERGMLWACGVVADFVHHDDNTILRAGKVIIANDPSRFEFVRELVELMERKRHAA